MSVGRVTTNGRRCNSVRHSLSSGRAQEQGEKVGLCLDYDARSSLGLDSLGDLSFSCACLALCSRIYLDHTLCSTVHVTVSGRPGQSVEALVALGHFTVHSCLYFLHLQSFAFRL